MVVDGEEWVGVGVVEGGDEDDDEDGTPSAPEGGMDGVGEGLSCGDLIGSRRRLPVGRVGHLHWCWFGFVVVGFVVVADMQQRPC